MSHTSIALPGQETLLASWNALAQISPGARLIHATAATAAVFPSWAPLNNAILLTDHDTATANAVAELTGFYTDAGVDAWALWLPSSAADLDTPSDVQSVPGFARDTTTLVMQAELAPGLASHDAVVRTSIASATTAGDEPTPSADLEKPDTGTELAAWVFVDDDDMAVAGAWSLLHERDCGIYAVETVPSRRRRGLGRALVEHVLADAHRRGALTATLQSTPMAQALYTSMGFAPAGRYEEWLSRS